MKFRKLLGLLTVMALVLSVRKEYRLFGTVV